MIRYYENNFCTKDLLFGKKPYTFGISMYSSRIDSNIEVESNEKFWS